MLLGVFLVLALLITPQLRDWWLQQRRLHELRTGITASQREVDALRTERARWQDPAYVKAQARDRLHFVMPGETGFAVIGGSTAEQDPDGTAVGPQVSPSRPWFAQLWRSVQAAGDPGNRGRPLTDQQLIDRQLIDRQPAGAVPQDEVLVDQGQP